MSNILYALCLIAAFDLNTWTFEYKQKIVAHYFSSGHPVIGWIYYGR